MTHCLSDYTVDHIHMYLYTDLYLSYISFQYINLLVYVSVYFPLDGMVPPTFDAPTFT